MTISFAGRYLPISVFIAIPREERYVCGGKAYVYCFGGLLSGTGWGGFCRACGSRAFVWDSTRTWQRSDFLTSANRQFKNRVREVEEYEATEFSFGPEALVPAIKTREVIRSLVEVISVAELVKELQTNTIRSATPKESVERFLDRRARRQGRSRRGQSGADRVAWPLFRMQARNFGEAK